MYVELQSKPAEPVFAFVNVIDLWRALNNPLLARPSP